jgi:hypothetical protein
VVASETLHDVRTHSATKERRHPSLALQVAPRTSTRAPSWSPLSRSRACQTGSSGLS